ncbi:MAG: V-type ATP synthase subunit B, partial [Candidatus Korarchaeota archaeon]|nr:V-type ATP synthase subunit B [Candidatus Korarchaeota archaeon]
MSEGGVQYSKIAEIKGPLVIVDGIENAAYDELVEIETKEGERRLGKVLEVGNGQAIVQVFEGTTGLSVSGTNAKFVGRVMEMPVSKELLGRVFDGLGRPKDGLPEPIA